TQPRTFSWTSLPWNGHTHQDRRCDRRVLERRPYGRSRRGSVAVRPADRRRYGGRTAPVGSDRADARWDRLTVAAGPWVPAAPDGLRPDGRRHRHDQVPSQAALPGSRPRKSEPQDRSVHGAVPPVFTGTRKRSTEPGVHPDSAKAASGFRISPDRPP